MDKPIQLSGVGGDAKIGGIKEVSMSQDAVSAEVVQNSSLVFGLSSGAVNTYAVSLTPAISTYAAGQLIVFKAHLANTGSATLNVNGLGAKSIKKQVSSDLGADDIKVGQMVTVIYDGTQFQMASPTAAAAAATGYSLTNVKRIFTTSTTYSGNLGGIAGADSKCQARAQAAGLTGSWKALISVNWMTARSRSTHNAIVVNMAGDIVAFGFRDLFVSLYPNQTNTSKQYRNMINITELGTVSGGIWWNGTTPSGEFAGNSCNNWTSGDGSVFGHYGDCSSFDNQGFFGTSNQNYNCNNLRPIVCFEE